MKREIRIRAETYALVKSGNYSKQQPKFILEYMKMFGDGCFEVCIDCVDKTDVKNTSAVDSDRKYVSNFIHEPVQSSGRSS